MNKLVYWFFSKTKVGKFFDGKKTELGFAAGALAFALLGAAELTESAMQQFPNMPMVVKFDAWTDTINASFQDLLQFLATVGISTGVWHDKLKRNRGE